MLMKSNIAYQCCKVFALCFATSHFFMARASAEPPVVPTEGFYAYYTKIHSHEPFEKYSRTGDYADLVVNVGDKSGQLVFWRGTSYLPYWETEGVKWPLPELLPRSGDGTASMPDRVNSFSHVRIIEQGPDEVVVHWRYLPQFSGTNPHSGYDATKFAEEVFYIHKNGRIVRVVKQGTPLFDDWTDPANAITQELQLDKSGITVTRQTEPTTSIKPSPARANPLKLEMAAEPVLEWRFDEAVGTSTAETRRNFTSVIAGHKPLWRRGVSGTALLFDGYTSAVELPPEQAPKLIGSLTLEGWVALGAYPWNWAPVVHQGDDDGYFLGVDGLGRPGLKLSLGNTRCELVASQQLERHRWYHLAATYDCLSGQGQLFIDGKSVAESNLGPGVLTTPNSPIKIGKGKERFQLALIPYNSASSGSYTFDGLIDEVRVYDTALGPELVARSYELVKPEKQVITQPELEKRALPDLRISDKFGATYSRLKFYDTWDVLWRFGDYADVVVNFNSLPYQFVFWRGTGYIPMLANEKQQWYSNQFNETANRSGGRGCQEPMSDKESYTNHVRIIENTPARVLVHWRYPLLDVRHIGANFNPETGWCDYADWYYYIYPDGMAVKQMKLWTDGPRNHEWHESMAILGPNQHPEEVIDTNPALVLAGFDGNEVPYSWIEGPPQGVSYQDKKVHIVKYKAEFSPYTIGDFTGGDVYAGNVRDYAVFPTWNHWPEAQMPSDGRYALFNDRTSHSSLTHVTLPDYRAQEDGDLPFQEKLLIEGMTNQPVSTLVTLAKSWLNAPSIEIVSGCEKANYEQAEKAYVLSFQGPDAIVRLLASTDQPLVNPCFVFTNWNSNATVSVSVDGHSTEKNVRQGIVRDANGKQKLIVWIETESTTPMVVAIGPSDTAEN